MIIFPLSKLAEMQQETSILIDVLWDALNSGEGNYQDDMAIADALEVVSIACNAAREEYNKLVIRN